MRNRVLFAPGARRDVHTIVDVVDDAASRAGDVRVHVDRELDAFPDSGLTLTYADLASYGVRLSAALSHAGVRAGDRVAIVKANHVDTFLLAYAAMRLGAVPALISPDLAPEVARELLDRLGNPPIVTDPTVAARKALRGIDLGHASRLPLAVGGHVDGAVELDLDAPPAAAEVIADPDVPVLITHTSGTTNVPKLAIQSHRTIAANVAAARKWSRMIRLNETIGFHLSFAHVRTVTGMTSFMDLRCPMVVVTDPAPSNVDAMFSEFRPGAIETFPNTFVVWESLLGSPTRPLSNGRVFYNTFDAMHPRTLQALLEGSERRMPIYIQTYGQTETGPVSARFYTRGLARRADSRCVGHPLTGFSRWKIDRGDGSTDRGKDAGEVLARTKSMVLGYVGQDRLFADGFRDGWWRMTDVGRRSACGCLHLNDRVIDESSHTESLLALEDLLMRRLPKIVEGVLVPMSDGTLSPVVCTRNDEPLDAGEWTSATVDFPPLNPVRHCRWDAVPHTSTWKVRRVETRELIRTGQLPAVEL